MERNEDHGLVLVVVLSNIFVWPESSASDTPWHPGGIPWYPGGTPSCLWSAHAQQKMEDVGMKPGDVVSCDRKTHPMETPLLR